MLKTLVIVTPGFPKDEADTTCIPPQQIFVKALKKVRPDLNVIVLTLQYPFTPKTYQWHGIKVIALGGKEKGGLKRGTTWIKAWLVLKQINKQYPLIGILSFWLGECAWVADRFCKKNNLPHYTWILGQDAKPGNKYVKWIKPQSQSLVALSDFIVKEFASNYHIMPVHVIPVGIDTDAFSAPADKRNIDLMGVGSLIPLKQYDVFINLVYELKKDFPNIKALICGDGPYRQKLEEMTDRLQLNEQITLLGELPHNEVLKLMQRSKVFLHTSNYEGFGAVNLEALYAGAKVVSFVQPMDAAIPNWHIAANPKDLLQTVVTLLSNEQIYEPTTVYLIEDNARQILSLFDHNDAAIS